MFASHIRRFNDCTRMTSLDRLAPCGHRLGSGGVCKFMRRLCMGDVIASVVRNSLIDPGPTLPIEATTYCCALNYFVDTLKRDWGGKITSNIWVQVSLLDHCAQTRYTPPATSSIATTSASHSDSPVTAVCTTTASVFRSTITRWPWAPLNLVGTTMELEPRQKGRTGCNIVKRSPRNKGDCGDSLRIIHIGREPSGSRCHMKHLSVRARPRTRVRD